MSKYETIIGLEVHLELSTNSKIFCPCSTEFGAPPNTHTCPVCLGHPGVLPVLNREAVNYAIKSAIALHCDVATHSKFDRKNYFYPDSPKAYQISQYDRPVGEHGWLEIDVEGSKKRIGITRLHLEEDAGKLHHIDGKNESLVDFNRVGVPLIEIVSEPDMRSPQEAKAYLEKLKLILQYLGVSDVKMEEGSLRCDANISLRPIGQAEFGAKTEMKNLNSFRNVERALEYEQQRQSEALDRGEVLVQQTCRWLEGEEKTKLMRSKEDAHDYRYFPEPDLVSLHINSVWKAEMEASIPELPDLRKKRYMEEFSLSDYDAGILVSSKELGDYYDKVVDEKADSKTAANWVTCDLLGYLNKQGMDLAQVKSTPQHMAQLIGLIEKGTISTKIARTVWNTMLETGKAPMDVVQEQGLVQISDIGQLKEEVAKVISQNPQSLEDLKNGKDRALGFLVGQVMKATKGKANPQVVNELIKEHV